MLRYKEVKSMLLDEISKCKPTDKLMSRPLLCKKFDTTRTTLDKAVKELVEEGILVSKNGSGTFIAPFSKEELVQSGSNWGIIVPNIMDDVYPGIIRGAENIAQGYGINLILCNSDNNADKQEQYIRRLLISGISGFIIVPVISNDVRENLRLYSQLTDAKVPFVFCNRSIEGIDVPTVTSNSFYGGYIATKHLINRGYKNIAFISKLKYRTSIERCHGYVSALIESGIEINRGLVILDGQNDGSHDGYTEMKRLLDSDVKIDAVFCFNDYVVKGVCKAIKEYGLKVSDDIGIIGYDNSDICTMLEPKITSVSYKNVEIGERAAELLWKMINHMPVSEFNYYLFQPEIVIRESCLGPRSGP